MNKLAYNSLPRFTRNPSYRVNTEWQYLESTLERWMQYESCALDLDPDFQRGHVWTTEQQRKYVEYILQGGTSGREIYFNCHGWQSHYKGPFVIVDGKQRLEAVRQFLANKLPIFPEFNPNNEGLLKENGDWNVKGFYRKDIEGRLPTTAYFYFNVNDLPTRKEVLQWYLEMNTGGTPHTDAEIQKVKDMLAKEK